MNQAKLDVFFAALRPHLKGELRTDTYSKILYSTDASLYQAMPYGVLIPQNSDDIQAALELAYQYEIPLVPRTSGSSLAGQAINEALAIDMTRHLDRILEVNVEEKWARVQPGVVLDELNAHLKPMGLQFGPDPASSNRAAMGGILSTNATGSHSILYGMAADHLLEANVILSDGTLAHFAPVTDLNFFEQKTGLEGALYRDIQKLVTENADTIRAGTPRHWRRCGGYNLDRMIDHGGHFLFPQDPRFNLAKLISGAEGSLAVMTELKLNLVPVPKMTALGIVHYQDLPTALSAVPVLLGTHPSAIELLDNLGLTMCRDVPGYARLLATFAEGNPYCILIVEYDGESEAELHAKLAALKKCAPSTGASAIVPLLTPQAQNNVWTVRKVGLGLLMSVKGDQKPIPFIEDAAVPVEFLPEYIQKMEDFCAELGTPISYYGHASAGCLHIRPMINTKAAHEVAKMPHIAAFSMELLHGYGGALSSEHGDGRTRSWLNRTFFGEDLYRLYQDTKHIFDPKNLLNPGMVVNAPPMTQHLRYGESYSVIPLHTKLDFSHELDVHRAVEMCNGAGVCRKKTTGTMCPSFMVTREEEHSTRGRANALRAAMSGLLPAEELTSPRMYEVMDLCIECKACKAECPSSVDMAKLKFEFLAHYHEKHGIPLRARLFAHIAFISRWSSGRIAPLVNASLDNRWVRWGMEKLLGISRQRPLPKFARVPFTTWFRQHKPLSHDGGGARGGGEVVLFHDTFNTYNDPHIAIAATEVLEAAGFEVVLPGHKCCGRPMISKGLVDSARVAARDTVKRLAPFARQGLPIIGLEPSCILTLRDEYLYLLPDDEDARLVAQNALTYEEFFARLADENRLPLQFSSEKRALLLHGHCHQKALVGTVPSKKILSLPENYTVQEVDSGCCGMAGSFGYEAEHAEISLQMGERRLLPAVRQSASDTLIVAAGTSCRQQIQQGTGKKALHPAEVLREAIL